MMAEVIDRGICRLSLVPVRAEPRETAEMVTQLLFGEHYLVSAQQSNWIQIVCAHDDYTGWIDINQHHSISEDYFHLLSSAEYKISTDLTSEILFNKKRVQVVMGSILPLQSNELFPMEEQMAFAGQAKPLGEKKDVEFVEQTALKFLHAPYLWGGRSPFGVDCSGLVQQVFRMAGYRLSRDAAQQIRHGKSCTFSELEHGCLAFFENDSGKISHVGLILEDGKIIHASGSVRLDRLDERGIVHSETGKVTHRFAQGRRILM